MLVCVNVFYVCPQEYKRALHANIPRGSALNSVGRAVIHSSREAVFLACSSAAFLCHTLTYIELQVEKIYTNTDGGAHVCASAMCNISRGLCSRIPTRVISF